MASRRPERWLAPLALLGALLAILLTVSSSHSGSSDSGEDSPTATTTVRHRTSTTSGTRTSTATSTTSTTTTASGGSARTYTVRSGDVLSAIAASTNVPLARIEELNPGVDAQSLRVGQKIKLAP